MMYVLNSFSNVRVTQTEKPMGNIKISEEVKLEKQDNSQVMKVSEILNYRITISLHI